MSTDNSSYNRPFWNAGTCNCKSFALSAADGARAATWKQPTTGVVHMFHSVLCEPPRYRCHLGCILLRCQRYR